MSNALSRPWEVVVDSSDGLLVSSDRYLVAVISGGLEGSLGLSIAREIVESHNLLLGPPEEMFAVPRSGHWEAVRNHHLKEHPTCAACGSRTNLQVHHIKPYHLFNELELEPTNLITLCMTPGMLCHLRVGHGGNWKSYAPDVVEESARLLESRKKLLYGGGE